MIKILRRHRHWLMIVIAILALPFCIYFVKTDYSAIRPDQFARIYDRSIPMVEARQNARLLDLARSLGMSDFVQSLTVGASDQNQVYAQSILNLLILRHEADRLGIRPAPSEVADVVRDLPAFRSEGGFDFKKFSYFVHIVL